MHHIPTLNVNLKPCTCGNDTPYGPVTGWTCFGTCPGVPVLVPCPIPPSVTFEVRLVECDCVSDFAKTGNTDHMPTCAVCPIRVSCSISGKTWEESEVDDCEKHGPEDFAHDGIRIVARDICRERWALVKALLLHHGEVSGHTVFTPESLPLLQQRDAVFDALAAIAHAESTIIQRFADIDKVHTNRSRRSFQGFAADELAAYVEHLVEQVGVMT